MSTNGRVATTTTMSQDAISNLPWREKRELQFCLNRDVELFKILTHGVMKYDQQTVERFLKTENPTSALLKSFDDLDHTILDLFGALYKMAHLEAMTILKDLIDEKTYAKAIREAEARRKRAAQKEVKICNVDPIGRQAAPVAMAINQQQQQRLPQPQQHAPETNARVLRAAGLIFHVPYAEVAVATNNWTQKLGRGAFGDVFKGTWHNTEYAFKRLKINMKNQQTAQTHINQTIAELKALNECRHDNILPLYGFSMDGPEPCLVYKFMPGGSLEERLKKTGPETMTLEERLRVAVDTALGLQFLHTCSDRPLVHCDIKPANILLDGDGRAVIGDFGLAREYTDPEHTHMLTNTVAGTRQYLPDDYQRNGQFRPTIDSFSFGVVLLELATNRTVVGRNNVLLKDHVLNHHGDVMLLRDDTVEGDDAIFRGLLEIGKRCVDGDPRKRPSMVKVFEDLKKLSDNQRK